MRLVPGPVVSETAADAAAGVWRALVPVLAGAGRMRVSRDGRTFPARSEQDLGAVPPAARCTVPVYGPDGSGRVLVLDVDPGRAGGDTAEVARQAAAIAALVGRAGGRAVTDVSTSTGGRHVYVRFAAALPWRELARLARAVAVRYPAVDAGPMLSAAGPSLVRTRAAAPRLAMLSQRPIATT